MKPEDVDRLHFIPFDEDEEDQCIQLFSFCKKHRPLSNEPLLDERIAQQACERGDYTPPSNASGCARTGMAINLYICFIYFALYT